MSVYDFIGMSSVIVMLIVFFIVGSYASFYILKNHYESSIEILKLKVKNIVEIKLQLRDNLANLAIREQNNTEIISMYDKLFKETLVDIASKTEGELKTFVLSTLEEYLEKKKTFYVKN